MDKKTKPDFSSMLEKWPSSFVARDKVSEFTGGIISPGYLANLDSDKSKSSPPERIRIGRKIAYSTKIFVKWLEGRSELLVENEDQKIK